MLKKKKTYNSTFIGKEVEILLKGKGKSNQYRGTTKWMQSVIFETKNNEIKKKLKIKIKNALIIV